MAERTWQLRQLSVADLLDETIRLYRHNWLTLVGIVALLQVPMAVLRALVLELPAAGAGPYGSQAIAGNTWLIGTLALGALDFFVITNLLTAATAVAVANRYLDRPVTLRGAYRVVLRRFWPLCGALLLVALITVGLLLLNIIPIAGTIAWIPLAIWVNNRLQFVTQAVVLEGESARGAVRRSWGLVEGYGWRVLGVYLLLAILATLVISGPSYIIIFTLAAVDISPALLTIVNASVTTVLTVVFTPVRVAGMTLQYYDLRIRKEALDLELQTESLRSAPQRESWPPLPDDSLIPPPPPLPDHGSLP